MNGSSDIVCKIMAQLEADFEAIVLTHLKASNDSYSEDRISSSRLRELILRYQSALVEMGVKRGERIVLLFPLQAELVALMIAIMSVGAVVVFVDTGMSRQNILASLIKISPRMIVSSEAILKLLRWLPHFWRTKFVCTDDSYHGTKLSGFGTNADIYLERHVDSDSPALITFTSGTTGRPKAANRTRSTLFHQHIALSRVFQNDAGSSFLHCFPVAILHHLANAEKIVMPAVDLSCPGIVNPKLVIEQLMNHQVETLGGAPHFIHALISYLYKSPELVQELHLKSLFVGGATVSIDLAQRIATTLPQCSSMVLYGSTEAEPMSHISIPDYIAKHLKGKGYPVGIPDPSAQIRVVPPESIQQQMNVESQKNLCGSIGEILVQGEHVVKEYWFNDAANRETKIRSQSGDIWHRTGDLAYQDEEYCLWLLGRDKDYVVLGTEKVPCYTLERDCDKLHSVSRSCLISLGKRSILCFEMNVGFAYDFALDELHAFLNHYQISNLELQQVSLMPVDKRHNSKIDRLNLAQMLRKPMKDLAVQKSRFSHFDLRTRLLIQKYCSNGKDTPIGLDESLTIIHTMEQFCAVLRLSPDNEDQIVGLITNELWERSRARVQDQAPIKLLPKINDDQGPHNNYLNKVYDMLDNASM